MARGRLPVLFRVTGCRVLVRLVLARGVLGRRMRAHGVLAGLVLAFLRAGLVLAATTAVGLLLPGVAERAVPLVRIGLGVTLGLVVLAAVAVFAVPLIRVSRGAGLLVSLLRVRLVPVALVGLIRVPGLGVGAAALVSLAAVLARVAVLLVPLLRVAACSWYRWSW